MLLHCSLFIVKQDKLGSFLYKISLLELIEKELSLRNIELNVFLKIKKQKTLLYLALGGWCLPHIDIVNTNAYNF